jgi:hypothetical protein
MAKRRRRKNRTEKRAPKRISAALSRYLKKMNPAKMRGVKTVRVRKLKGGGVTITPVRNNPRYDILVKVPGERNWRGWATIEADSPRKAIAIFRRDIHPARGEKLKARRRR